MPNTNNTIADLISELKTKWVPKMEKRTGSDYHGNNKGDEKEYTVYFDEYRMEWTTKRRAFQGYVFNHVNEFIKL